MTAPDEPEPKPQSKSEVDRLKAISHLPDRHLDMNFYYAVDHLKTATEAMHISFAGINLDRTMTPKDLPYEEIIRRWAAHLVILQDIYFDIQGRVNNIHADVKRLLALD